MAYKKHVSVESGIINKVAITPVNVTDAQGIGRVMANKGYCTSPVK